MYDAYALVLALSQPFRLWDSARNERDVNRKNTGGGVGSELPFSLPLPLLPLTFSRSLTSRHNPLSDHLEQALLVTPLRNRCETMSSPSFSRGVPSRISLAQLFLRKIIPWEITRHFSPPSLVSSRNDAWETSTTIPYWWRVTSQIWVVLLIGCARREICFTL